MPEGGVPTTYVVKNGRHRHPELFDREKLHKSIVAACLSAGTPMGTAENTARRVVDMVSHWLEKRPEVTSNDLRRIAAKELRTYHPDASYIYENHRSIM